MRKIDTLIIHCSATPAGWMEEEGIEAQAKEIKRWHVEERGWKDIGYHWIIGRTGRVIEGRGEETVGAHAKGHNSNSIGICLIGGYGLEKNDDPRQHYTGAQLTSLRGLIGIIKHRHPTVKFVYGHNRFANKSCPGFNVTKWLKGTPDRPLVRNEAVKAASEAVTKAGPIGAISGVSVAGLGGAITGLDRTSQLAAVCGLVILGLGYLYFRYLHEGDG